MFRDNSIFDRGIFRNDSVLDRGIFRSNSILDRGMDNDYTQHELNMIEPKMKMSHFEVR